MNFAKDLQFFEQLACFKVLVNFLAKVAKSAPFRQKARKIVDLAKNLQLFEQITMFRRFDGLFFKKLQKVPHFVKKHEKSSIWRKVAIF